MRPLLAGDSSYPLTNWLVKPYADRGRLTPEGLMSSSVRYDLIAFKKVEQKGSTLKKTVIAACILHNICIERGDLYDDTDDNDDRIEAGQSTLQPSMPTDSTSRSIH
ncbi:hypothetical protein P5673_012218, partial [Acropora cervicornis]